MDKSLFIGSSGAKETLHNLATITNNLANSNTIGFREDLDSQKQMPVGHNAKMQSRSYSMLDKTFVNLNKGPVITTGRDLDVAIAGEGFIAVQSKSGQEGYTRAGDLQITHGVLTTHNNDKVLAVGSGIIQIPGDAIRIHIGNDGTVAAKLKNQAEPINIGRIKLTNPNIADLKKGSDGLLYTISGDAKQDDSVRLINNSLEGSNVNPIETLTKIIDLSRQFEMHGNLIKTLSENANKSNQILTVK